ncbi:MAG: hypothetical protein CDV28_10611 [Candidatus Electronema aureum]|uniref:Uncharacterized protein n=1 Tax=Candidatus Electronema aureum TaxID=2005002 RepID=A0A521G344_9BACT|nr:MAG: hypothetical protein CDV28_10611 [Candidatus Electronema aureum]
MKKMSASLVAAIFMLAFFISHSSAAETKIDPSILKIINEIVLKMQQDTMAATYAEMPFKNQMRGKMIVQNASKNYMQSVIQPQMMQKNMGAEKLKLMNRMSQF